MSNDKQKKVVKKKYLGGLVVTISSHSNPKQVREEFTVNSFDEAVAKAVERA